MLSVVTLLLKIGDEIGQAHNRNHRAAEITFHFLNRRQLALAFLLAINSH
ncbi:Uncharacterised protein [Vibrio cholerae]|uniref:Uncharacterized protein n=1 Tax=Vibrio cholerae TaxID=666 RepID=A0A655YSD2_VIBCL|nr:Uncharacterised protein [Vibrio cholerae]